MSCIWASRTILEITFVSIEYATCSHAISDPTVDGCAVYLKSHHNLEACAAEMQASKSFINFQASPRRAAPVQGVSENKGANFEKG
jgi:hypothetical protein